jgi:hypothetical protein
VTQFDPGITPEEAALLKDLAKTPPSIFSAPPRQPSDFGGVNALPDTPNYTTQQDSGINQAEPSDDKSSVADLLREILTVCNDIASELRSLRG